MLSDSQLEEVERVCIAKAFRDTESFDLFEEKDFTRYKQLFRSARKMHDENDLFDENGNPRLRELSTQTGMKLSTIANILMTDCSLSVMNFELLMQHRKEMAMFRYAEGTISEEEFIDEIHLYKERTNPSNEDDESDFMLDAITVWDKKASARERPIKIESFGALAFVLPVLRKGELIILAARPASGKSALALQIADEVATKGHKVLYVSLEMETEQMARRYVQMSNPVGGFQRFDEPDTLTKEDWQKIYKSLERHKGNLIIRKGLYKMSQIRQVVKKLKPELLIIDQLTLVKDNNPKSDLRVTMTHAAYGSKNLALDMDIPVIALTQIRRPSGSSVPAEPEMHDLKESGSIEEAADAVLMIHRVDESQMKNYHAFENANYEHLVNGGDHPIYLKDAKGRNSGIAGTCCLYEGKRFRFKDCYFDM